MATKRKSPQTPAQSDPVTTIGSSSEVLYRKWRPQTFAEVVGQEPITQTVRNSVAAGRLGHAYLFCGPRGTGKTSTGRLLAKAANCLAPVDGEPCNACESCRAFLEGRAIDLVEMDAASNRGIEEIRKLRDRVGLAPMAGRYKVYLVDEVHMLTAEAYNALLKTLEEPPPHIIFVLATTESHKVPATIISRCQRFDFRRLPMAAVVAGLQRICQGESIGLDEAALQEIARSAGGSLRDAINLVEQLASYYGSSPTLEQVRDSLGLTADARSRELVRHILAKDLSAGLRLIASVRDDGVDMRQFQRELVNCLRSLLLVKAEAGETLDLGAEEMNQMRSLAEGASAEDVMRALRGFGQADFRDDAQSSLPLELALAEHVLGPAVPEVSAPEPEPPPRARFTGAPPSAGRPPFRPPGSTFGPEARPRPGGPGQAGPRPPGPERPRPVVPRSAPAVEPGLRARLQEEPPPDATPAAEASAEAPVEGAVAAPRESAREPAGAQQGDDFLRRLRLACNELDSPPHRVGAYLNGTCEVQSLENGVLVLAFYQQFSIHKGKTEQPAHRRIIEEAASKLTGQAVTLECTLSEQARPPGPVKSGGHLVQAARQMGARPVIGGKGGPSGAARNEP
jgi:DNA polymerase-3 subunit gamma/tau